MVMPRLSIGQWCRFFVTGKQGVPPTPNPDFTVPARLESLVARIGAQRVQFTATKLMDWLYIMSVDGFSPFQGNIDVEVLELY